MLASNTVGHECITYCQISHQTNHCLDYLCCFGHYCCYVLLLSGDDGVVHLVSVLTLIHHFSNLDIPRSSMLNRIGQVLVVMAIYFVAYKLNFHILLFPNLDCKHSIDQQNIHPSVLFFLFKTSKINKKKNKC